MERHSPACARCRRKVRSIRPKHTRQGIGTYLSVERGAVLPRRPPESDRTDLVPGWPISETKLPGSDRTRFGAELEKALAKTRCVQIRGLAGSGKSVVLRQAVEADLAKGPTLFLHSDRLSGNGWSSFATANGLSSAPLKDVLVEISALGSSTLFIDGIDRVTKEHQGIILDLVRTILKSPECDNWRIVHFSPRDTGIQPLRNWLGELLDASGIATVEVGSLDDDEAEALAQAKPPLRLLLFGLEPAKSIVRRPFFAKILAQTAAPTDSAPSFAPKSEGDLLEHWWLRGGFNVSGQDAILRQRALIELATLSGPKALAYRLPSIRRRHRRRTAPLTNIGRHHSRCYPRSYNPLCSRHLLRMGAVSCVHRQGAQLAGRPEGIR